jgi:hypothetical protein
MLNSSACPACPACPDCICQGVLCGVYFAGPSSVAFHVLHCSLHGTRYSALSPACPEFFLGPPVLRRKIFVPLRFAERLKKGGPANQQNFPTALLPNYQTIQLSNYSIHSFLLSFLRNEYQVRAAASYPHLPPLAQHVCPKGYPCPPVPPVLTVLVRAYCAGHPIGAWDKHDEPRSYLGQVALGRSGLSGGHSFLFVF